MAKDLGGLVRAWGLSVCERKDEVQHSDVTPVSGLGISVKSGSSDWAGGRGVGWVRGFDVSLSEHWLPYL